MYCVMYCLSTAYFFLFFLILLQFLIQELGDMTSKLEHALQDVKEKDVSRQQNVQELENCQTELDDLKNSFKTVSDELERVNVEV